MKTKNQDKNEMIENLTFNQIKKKTLNIKSPKYDLCKILSMC